MSYCPYSDKELQKWDGVCNPMGKACNDCDDYECEHNPNPNPNEICYHHVFDYGVCVYCGFKKPDYKEKVHQKPNSSLDNEQKK